MRSLRSPSLRPYRKPGFPLVAGAAAALALIALPVSGQTTGQNPGQPAAQGTGQSAAVQSGTTTPARASQTGTADQEREWIEDMAHAHIGEIETGKVALEKSQNPQVRQFAQQMIDDHTRGLQELHTLGQRKNIQVPEEADFAHKAFATALRLLSGDFFDNQYIRHIGVNDHRRTLELVQQVSREAKDPDLRAHASKSRSMIQRHLTMAQQLQNQRDASSGTQHEGQSGTQQAPQRN